MGGFGDSLNVEKLTSEVVDTAQKDKSHTVALLIDPFDDVFSPEVVLSLEWTQLDLWVSNHQRSLIGHLTSRGFIRIKASLPFKL